MTGPPSVAPRAPSAAHSKAALASDGDGPRLVQAKQALRTAQCARNDAVHLLRGTYVGVRVDTEAAATGRWDKVDSATGIRAAPPARERRESVRNGSHPPECQSRS